MKCIRQDGGIQILPGSQAIIALRGNESGTFRWRLKSSIKII